MKDYDFIFSLGFSCGTSQALRAAGLQFASYPLDWVGVYDLGASVRAIEEDFAHWMEPEDMRLVDVRHGAGFLTRAYFNTRTQMGFSHEFSDFKPFADAVPRVRQTYEGRAVRFQESLRQAKRILAVWVEPPMIVTPDLDAYREALERLRRKCPTAEVSLLVFCEDPGCGEPKEIADRGGVTVVTADYRRVEKGVLTHYVDYAQFIRYLKTHAAMKDPRTDEERRQYAEQAQKIGTLRWGPDKSRFRRWLNQRAYKLYRSLERILQNRGIVHREGAFWFTEDIARQAKEAVK